MDEGRNGVTVQTGSTVDPAELRHFDGAAGVWWDEGGTGRWLHKLNPVRTAYVLDLIARAFHRPDKDDLDGLRILDLGCGAGVLCEPLARRGAAVVGVDPGPALIDEARRHAAREGLAIDYRCATPEILVGAGERFDVVLALDVAEHVADSRLFIDLSARLVAPGGLVMFSTMNRTWKSWFQTIVMGEYVLRFLPRGTHRWDKFIKPEEVRAAPGLAEFELVELKGLTMNLRTWRLEMSDNSDVTYFIAFRRAD